MKRVRHPVPLPIVYDCEARLTQKSGGLGHSRRPLQQWTLPGGKQSKTKERWDRVFLFFFSAGVSDVLELSAS